MTVLSTYQAAPLLRAQAAGQTVAETTPDLGLSVVTVALDEAGVRFPDGACLTWEMAAHIRAADTQCFAWGAGEWREIKVFSEETERVYTLMPTPRAPTMLISGLPMHRIKDVDPWEDTERKLKALGRPRGVVLDTSMGLGYTAQAAARHAERVITIEFDPAVLELAWHNPWSRPLFTDPRLEVRLGDAYDVAPEFPAASFGAIVHDPPTFSLAGHLYSGVFYQELYRVLKPGGRLFHYIGNPDSPSGARTTRGVVKRLKEAGFERVEPRPEAFGVTARK